MWLYDHTAWNLEICEDLVLDLDLETSNLGLDLDLEHFFFVTRLVNNNANKDPTTPQAKLPCK